MAAAPVDVSFLVSGMLLPILVSRVFTEEHINLVWMIIAKNVSAIPFIGIKDTNRLSKNEDLATFTIRTLQRDITHYTQRATLIKIDGSFLNNFRPHGLPP